MTGIIRRILDRKIRVNDNMLIQPVNVQFLASPLFYLLPFYFKRYFQPPLFEFLAELRGEWFKRIIFIIIQGATTKPLV